MKTGIGYLTAVATPGFSGLSNVLFRSRKRGRPGRLTSCYCESGFGVRQLVAAIGINGRLTRESGEIRVRYTIDDLSLLQTVEVL